MQINIKKIHDYNLQNIFLGNFNYFILKRQRIIFSAYIYFSVYLFEKLTYVQVTKNKL